MKKYKLGDIADINKQTLSKKDSMDVIEYLDTGSLTENIFGPKQVLSRKEAPSRAQRRVFDKTILYSTVRPRLKHYGFLESPKENTIVSTGFATIDVKDEFKNVIDARYLYLLLIQDKVTEYLGTIADTAVSAYPSLNPSDIQSLEFEFPDMPIQKKVASFLCNIDKRIENLRAQNRVLEQTAKTIYDYTFLQCAGHQTTYNKTLNRNIPADWEIDNLYRIADFTNGLACQKYRPITEKEKLPVIKIREMHDGVTADTEFVKSDIPEKVIVNPGDLLFSWSASLEVMMWNGVKGGLNQHIFKVTPKEYFSLYYVYFQLKDYIGNFKRMAEARKTTMGHITTDHLNQSRIAIPDEETMKRFSSQITPLFKKQLVNSQQIEALTTQRNTLLPLLMNGQIEVE
ncbi:restriction endonuclease subunit S [uncultured Fibrobacter sp.]|uniref:restriction endonuclease subunit S n=1 Tax=uncultured Fibrobacter sp. TaxID=261512 RepID=UPI002596C56C|nr:restriction endonuclease subunit S [uncultured Fibrobacter sp.]